VPGAFGQIGRLAAQPHQRFALGHQRHREQSARHRQPRAHSDRAAHLAHCVTPAAELGGDQRRRAPDQPAHRPHQQSRQRDAERRDRQRLLAEPGDEDHVDRIDSHLQQIGARQRPRETQGGGQLTAPGRGGLVEHKAGPNRRGWLPVKAARRAGRIFAHR